jgi:hypothetical protein
VFDGDIGTATKYFEKKFTAPIHPPLVAVFGPSEAEGEHAAAGSNGSVTQTKESVRTNDTTAVPVKPIKGSV